MAKVNVCDMCKKPGETPSRLALFVINGKKHTNKVKVEICLKCDDKLRNQFSNPVPIYNEGIRKANIPQVAEVEISADKPLEVASGQFKVPSSLSVQRVRTLNRENNTGCRHDEKSLDEDGIIRCRSCGQNVES